MHFSSIIASYLNPWKPVIALTCSPSRHLSSQRQIFRLFSVVPSFFAWGLFVPDRSSLFFCVCASFSPHTSLVLELRASFLPLPVSLCGWLLVFFCGSKCCLFFFCFLVICPYLIHPASPFSPFTVVTFQQCQSALSLVPFWISFSCIQFFVCPFQLPPSVFQPRLSLQRPFFSLFSQVSSDLRVSLVARCAAGSPPCCWGGTWRWCCAPWTWASSAPARWLPLTCRLSRGPPLVAAAPHRAPWSSGKHRQQLALQRLPQQLPRWPQLRRRLLWGQTSGRL